MFATVWDRARLHESHARFEIDHFENSILRLTWQGRYVVRY